MRQHAKRWDREIVIDADKESIFEKMASLPPANEDDLEILDMDTDYLSVMLPYTYATEAQPVSEERFK